MAEPNRSELYAVQETPLTTLNGSNGHHTSPESGAEDTFVFPASLEQTRYWMLAQLDPSSTASNMAISFDIEGQIDEHAAEAAIATLTMRHEALRTIFRLEGGVLSQVVLERPLYKFIIEDLSSEPANQREAVAAASVDRHGHTLINLHTGPVLHARLIHLGERRHIMALTMNHIVCDGWSNGLLIRDFTILYEAIVKGNAAVLPELPFQFADFSIWQHEYLESPAAKEASTFWKTHITADMPALDMPTDFPRTSGRSFPGHIESALLPKEIDDRLKEYCRKSGSTKHIVLLAAFEALCARYTGQTEFLLGSTIANRTQPGMEDVVGRFANPQIIVAKVDGDPTFAALEQRVRDWETAAYNHQDLPFSRIIEDFQIDQAGATSQFLQVWFLYQKAFMQPQSGATIRVTPRRSVSGGVDFDVLVSIVERAEGPRIQMEYNTELFKPERIQGLIASFTQLLGEGLIDPSRPLSQLAIADASAVSTPAVSSVKTVEPGEPLSIAARVRAHAGRAPEELAVAEEMRMLSWQQLEEQSSALAAELQRRKVSGSSTVAVLLAPQMESAIAFLGALKSGARVLPLPVHATAADIAKLLANMSVDGKPVLLAPRGFGAALDFEDLASLSSADGFTSLPGQLLFLTDAANATYASVAVADVIRSIDSAISVAGVKQGEAMLAFAAASPMDACLDLLTAFASGSQLSFARDLQTSAIESQLAQYQITRLLLSPTDLKRLATMKWQGDRRVALLVRGGRLPSILAASQNSILPRNTKSAVYLLSTPQTAGYAAAQMLSPAADGLLPLGDTALVILGPDGRALPNGAFGELQTSTGMSPGYMARSSATGSIELLDASERFLPLRGHRICLGDIEDALFSLPQLRDSLAAVTEAHEAQHLVAYLVAAQAGEMNGSAVRQHLSATLPSHLVPSEYIWLERLPRLLDGRVDLDHLPRAEAPAAPVKTYENHAELTAVEEKLSSIWREVLGLRQVDIHKPFFDLGGSSLLLVRLFARINKTFDTSLPITAIFDAQTIAELALTLGGATEISPMVQVQPHGKKLPLFMIHSYLLYKGLSTTLGTDQPFFGLRELDRDGHLTIEQRVTRYVQEIRKVQPQGPYQLAGWCAAGPLTVEVARQLLLADQQVSYLALFDSWLPGYIESIEASRPEKKWLPYKTVSSKLVFHRTKMRGLTATKKVRYLWMASARIVKEAQYRIYLRNWERLRKLSEKYNFALPQFMHNTSLDTFSALKDYREQLLPVHLTLIRASDSREVPGAAPTCGWERVADQGVDVLWAPGDHETMFVGENLRVTASMVESGLAAAQSPSAASGALASGSETSTLRGAKLHVDCPST